MKNKFFSGLTFIFFSNLWVAFIGFVLNIYYSHLLQVPPNLYLALFCFCCIFVAYNLHRIYKFLNHKNLLSVFRVWMEGYFKLIISLSIIAVIIGVLLGLHVASFQGLFFILIIALIFLGYAFFGGREIGFLKPLLISVCWVLLCCASCQIVSPQVHNMAYVSLSAFFSITSVALLSDIKDVGIDSKEMNTFSQKSIPKTVYISIFLFFVQFLFLYPMLSRSVFIAMLVASIFISIFLKKITTHPSFIFNHFLIDSLLLINPIIYFLGEINA